MLKSMFWWWVFAEMVRVFFGSQTTRSASAPATSAPFFGKMLKIFAVLVTSRRRTRSA
jgi:hypothetical protein